MISAYNYESNSLYSSLFILLWLLSSRRVVSSTSLLFNILLETVVATQM